MSTRRKAPARAPRDPFRAHSERIARDTMKLYCVGARIMGGMDHVQAAAVLGKPLPAGCTCRKPNTDADARGYVGTLRGKGKIYGERLVKWQGGELPPIPPGLSEEKAAAIRAGFWSKSLEGVRNPKRDKSGHDLMLAALAAAHSSPPKNWRPVRLQYPRVGWFPYYAPAQQADLTAWFKTRPECQSECDRRNRTGAYPPGWRELNPNAASSSAAAKLFERWHGYAPDKVEAVKLPAIDGVPLVFLGNLLRIDYQSPKWSRQRPGSRRRRSYWHESSGAPYVLAHPGGRVLVIVDPSGGLKVTPDGIVG